MYSRFFGTTFEVPVGAVGALGRGATGVDTGAPPPAAIGAVGAVGAVGVINALLGDVPTEGLGSATFAEGSAAAGFSGSGASGAETGRGWGSAMGSLAAGEEGGSPPLEARMIKLTTPMAAAATTARE